MARHRRFDPEIVKEAADKRMIQVDNNFLKKDKDKDKKGRPTSVIKLRPTSKMSVPED